MITDETGNVDASYLYEAFGRRVASDGEDRFLFGGQHGYQSEPLTGLSLLTLRSYDLKTGRFLNVDPIGLAGGGNVYGYCGNDPVSKSDPLGLFVVVPVWAIAALVAGSIGAAITGVKLRREGHRGWDLLKGVSVSFLTNGVAGGVGTYVSMVTLGMFPIKFLLAGGLSRYGSLLLSGAAGGAAGDLAGQATGNLVGAQRGFSARQLALMAAWGGVSGVAFGGVAYRTEVPGAFSSVAKAMRKALWRTWKGKETVIGRYGILEDAQQASSGTNPAWIQVDPRLDRDPGPFLGVASERATRVWRDAWKIRDDAENAVWTWQQLQRFAAEARRPASTYGGVQIGSSPLSWADLTYEARLLRGSLEMFEIDDLYYAKLDAAILGRLAPPYTALDVRELWWLMGLQ